MQTQRVVRGEEHRVAAADARSTMGQLLQQDGVRKVVLDDLHGHTILEVPVRPAEVGVVMEPVLAAAEAASRVVGEVGLRVEREGELPAEGGSRASMLEREREGARRQATGAEMTDNVTPEDIANAPANVTERDLERIREANAVPEGSEAAVERIEPEPAGEPELKDTGTPFAAGEPRRPHDEPSR